MAKSDEVVWVQLATRIPKPLHRDLKLHCVQAEISVMEFVTKAIGEKLKGSSYSPAKTAKRQGRAAR
jgi:predicted HicB family RNase H-like nuclease